MRRVSGRTRDGWRGGKAGEWGIGSVIRCSTVRAVRARVREKRRDKGRWVQVRTGGGARRGVGAPSPAYKPPHGRGAARSAAPRAKILGAAFIFRLTLKRKTVIINSR